MRRSPPFISGWSHEIAALLSAGHPVVRVGSNRRTFPTHRTGHPGRRPKFKAEIIESNFNALWGSDEVQQVAVTAAVSADPNPKFRSRIATARDNPFRQVNSAHGKPRLS
jgi:hypothetical protein